MKPRHALPRWRTCLHRIAVWLGLAIDWPPDYHHVYPDLHKEIEL